MEQQKISFQDIHAILNRMASDSAEFKKISAKRQDEFEAWKKKSAKEYEERQKNYKKEYEERQKKAEKETAELKASIKETNRHIGGIGKSLGDVTEDYFYSSISTTLNVKGIQYDSVEKKFTYKSKTKDAEYDIILINSTRILVVEVKHKLRQSDIEKFANKQLPLFKELFPEYKDYAIYGAVAGMTIEDECIEIANELGLYVFTQSQDTDNMLILNPKGFEPQKKG